ncbi:hypothetical protein [Williamsia sp. 1135]|uniref:hypothetical protein n=1 Tax=Williamsia sp. 1135 TaxID=1889262 RepID=UPI00117D77DD|nr:hypothetical protein [Williamsia sp. 1135]
MNDSAKESKKLLEWSEIEIKTLDMLGQTVDRAEDLRRVFDAERKGEGRPAMLVKISAEIRSLDRQISTFMAEIQVDSGPKVSSRHLKAATARWDPARRAGEY